MIITNRREIGYTIISRFEETFRCYLNKLLTTNYDDIFSNIPKGIIEKALERNGNSFENSLDFFENTDFPDLKEILLFKNHFSFIDKECIDKKNLISKMDLLYDLRCKIAHIKGSFTSIDLDLLVENVSNLSKCLNFIQIQDLI